MPYLIRSSTAGLFESLNRMSRLPQRSIKRTTQGCLNNVDYYDIFLSKGDIVNTRGLNIKDGCELRQINNELGLVNIQEEALTYYCDYVNLNVIANIRDVTRPTIKRSVELSCIYQSLVWRLFDDVISPKQFVKNVMFYHFLKNNTCLISDSYQTVQGKRLWINVINSAFENNLYVYCLVNEVRQNDKIISDLYPLEKKHKNALIQQAWYGTKSKDIRILISRKRLAS
ncbi:hypothetical protein KK075_003039 [Escherichia coli]|nr:hypothetical protein [Escherichia coli]EIB8314453.1 hypothetical protein [Escherichia coli]ELS9459249.1 hypothetical protein [Escherichia coli]ELW1472439.1 hypothetical protein [Escherichia coli]ELY7481028.1 hypothetical protein [Escherichia coli]